MNYNDVKKPKELYQFMKQTIKYGFVHRDTKQICIRPILGDEMYEQLLFNYYYLQKPYELLVNRCGLCYDQVELERDWFIRHGYFVFTYFSSHHNHAFLIFKDKNKYCLFERTFKEQNGIHTFYSLEETLDFYKRVQLNTAIGSMENIDLYPYNEVVYGCDFFDFKNNIIQNKTLIK